MKLLPLWWLKTLKKLKIILIFSISKSCGKCNCYFVVINTDNMGKLSM